MQTIHKMSAQPIQRKPVFDLGVLGSQNNSLEYSRRQWWFAWNLGKIKNSKTGNPHFPQQLDWKPVYNVLTHFVPVTYTLIVLFCMTIYNIKALLTRFSFQRRSQCERPWNKRCFKIFSYLASSFPTLDTKISSECLQLRGIGNISKLTEHLVQINNILTFNLFLNWQQSAFTKRPVKSDSSLRFLFNELVSVISNQLVFCLSFPVSFSLTMTLMKIFLNEK